MSANDIVVYSDGSFGPPNAMRHAVTSGTAASINVGEPVYKTLGSAFVVAKTASSTLQPSVGTDYIAGISVSTSTETASAAGTVDVLPNLPGMTYLCSPLVAASWDTQAEYDALVGNRTTFSVASGVVTVVGTTDTANGGVVVEPLDVAKVPGKIRFSLRQALNYTS